MGRIRKDFLLERYSIISEVRGARPQQYHYKTARVKSGQVCFFCPGNEHMTPPTIDRFPKTGPWEIRVFRNKFPALRPPQGDHEIVVETNIHRKGMQDLPADKLVQVFQMLEKRRLALGKKYKHVSIFKNYGREAGASLPHSHIQIIASNIIPTIVAQEQEAARRYFRKWHRCAWCDELKKLDRKRIAAETHHSIAVAANAPRFPYELWLMPRRHCGNFSNLDSEEALDLCRTLKRMLQKLGELGKPPYNLVFHYSKKTRDDSYHFHLELMPRLSTHAGYELGDGVYIVNVSPETAARFYRS